MTRSQKIRIYPNSSQEQYLLELCKFSDYCYNRGLAIWKNMYKTGDEPTMRKVRNYMKGHAMRDWERRYSPSIKDTALEDIDRAYKAFFRELKHKKKYHPPKFKQYNNKNSFRLYRKNDHSIRIREGKFFPPKMGKCGIRLSEDIRFNGEIATATVSRSNTGKWFLSITINNAVLKSHKEAYRSPIGGVGIDWGCKTFLTLSNGTSHNIPRQYDDISGEIKQLNQELAKTELGSNRHKGTRVKLSKAWERLSNFKTDYFNKLASDIGETYEWVGIEDLNTSGIMKFRLGSKMMKNSVQRFYEILSTKTKLIMIDRFYPSSQTCSNCNHKLETKLKLQDRTFECPSCGHTEDRDLNAAKNIYTVASKLI